ncbi:DivIVA domain-containing protein [Streptomyces sp. NPDC053427]|uniref:DivIVA domain-containing protein n=1 Tax=Streptomyces sp. NPDC053427 TaxID=3365701 RepID=UPI0037D0E6EA
MFSSRNAPGPGHEFGFSIVRRGYDRGQVDAYVERLSGAEPPTDPPAFALTRRGYDRGQVDAYIGELRARNGLGG